MTVGTTHSPGRPEGKPERAGTVLAIDGGNSKTDVLLVDSGGAVIASARSGGFTPQNSGVAAAIAVAAEAVGLIRAELAVPDGIPLARHLAAYVAGADLPVEEQALATAFMAQRWTDSVEVGNDTFALLRAGASRPWGVAVVCGAGINCAGIGPDGSRARFPALGRLTGDWGGGHYLGEEALWHAVRAEDGRGPATALVAAVAGHFGRPTVEAVALALHFGEIENERLGELAPTLMRVAAEHDPVAVAVVDRMAEEIVTMAGVALARLRITDRAAEIVLGGGVLRARPPALMDRIAARAAVEIPLAELVVAADQPVVGAALLGLDTLGLAVARDV
ncbi:MAG TPA: BadF/BadG/BcrA/BcrD ATPase family protein [Actinocrinis sp.]|uniref:N-acetylglucosamine kinase n=1 Tax=Actinocrinis sp. TaxID=1920516 RepID=UPI002DDCBE27|nr:BadF/BadG/BcrA/BcrD ATPase family protein [Actinocrinis sp.]HEV2347343.1 BadF/BadG/BcrA/BcrD ATPase family protein [Actinocrinis sp.]